MRLRGALIAAALLLSGGTAAAAQPATFDPAPWVADLDQLRDAMTARYPNLEWAAARGMDLPAAYSRARARLGRARNDYEARRALDRFVEGFRDGHLELRWPRPAASQGQAPAEPALCERLDYFDPDTPGIAPQLPGFRRVGAADALFTAGVVESAGRRVGVLQVPLFSYQGLPALCDRLIAQARLTPQSPCDDACRARLQTLAEGAFVQGLREQLEAVAAERPDVLLVDVAGNGGGDDSSVVLAKLVTDRPVRRPPAGLIRAEATAKELADRLAEAETGLRRSRGAERSALARFAAALQAAQAEARVPCDRGPLWRGEPIACTAIVMEPVYEGPLPGPGAPRPDWVSVAAPQARFPAVEPVWRGPLLVLVDEGSGSSSELFAAMLQDAGAAVIVGAHTGGAGCGHMTSAGPVRLRNSGAQVTMPDCLRLRADGTNEVAGVDPDAPVGFLAGDTQRRRVELLAAALPHAVAAAAGRR
ncbi:S41 family peptidase [Phenylobacterium sp.]|uniref:S41 family peptidase n=1 Tax=Phenylobacterium sp. TaxID=1871053 RepID=UPI002B77192E|nr:S41 family peptidase [Phenylobacterium sp.]HVI34123.1 S41 family peptidase [Phenylobacterium sp.]